MDRANRPRSPRFAKRTDTRARSFSVAISIAFVATGLGWLHHPTIAADRDGCWTGSIGSGQTMRQAFLVLGPQDGDLSLTLRVFDGELKDAQGSATMDGDTLRATVSRPDRDIDVALAQSAATKEWTGRLHDPKNGNLPASFAPATPQEDVAPFLGSWSGLLEAFGLRLVLHVSEGPCGQLIAAADSPDQGASGIPCTDARVSQEEGASTFHFAISFLDVTYTGTLSEAQDAIEGTFRQRGADLPFRLERGETVAPLARPQEPRPPFPYTAEDVAIENAAAGITLGGTLTLPEGEGPHPAVILITGSGAQNRNEELMGHKPFLLLADRLTRAGIAVLRTDDRGVGESGGNTMEATLDDVAGDVRAQLAYLKTRPEIDGGRMGLLGHSEGGWVAPLVEISSDDVTFLVLLAGPGVGGEEILHLQTAAIMRASGVGEDVIRNIRRYNEVVYETLKENLADEQTVAQILEGWSAVDQELTENERQAVSDVFGLTTDGREAHIRSQLSAIATPWFRHLLEYDPRSTLQKVDSPVLAIIGALDLQVPPEPNAQVLESTLRAAQRDDVQVIVMEGLNHLLQKARTGLPDEYTKIEETINLLALRRIEEWIVDTVRR